jgi:hypothetical protein
VPMPNKIDEAWNALVVQLKNVQSQPGTGSQAQKGIERNLKIVREYLEDKGSSNFQDFFQSLGEGIRVAQDSLDAQSEDYMRRRPAFAPETMFRIPKVSANLRLGIERKAGKAFDFVVIERTEESSNIVEQEISFDIIAAPPPPNALEAMADLPLGRVVVSNLVDREAAKERLKKELERQKGVIKEGQAAKKALKAAEDFVAIANDIFDDSHFRRTLVHRSDVKFVFAFVPPGYDVEKPDVGVGLLVLPIDEQSDLPVEAVRFGGTDIRSRIFSEILAPLSDRQSVMLAELGRS